MKTVVCLKIVRSALVFQESEQYGAFAVNPYDMRALKGALSAKFSCADHSVTVLSMSAINAKDELVRCLAMGADDAVLLNDAAFVGSDTVATSYILAEALVRERAQLVVFGARSVDGETGQVPYGVAQRLGLPCVGGVQEIIELQTDATRLLQYSDNCERELWIRLPAVIVFRDFVSVRESVSLPALRKARQKGVTIRTSEDLVLDISRCGQSGSRTKVLSSSPAFVSKGRSCDMIAGDANEKTAFLHSIISGAAGY